MIPQPLRRLGRRGRPLASLALHADARRELEALVRRRDVPDRIALRARLVLLAGDGLSNVAVAERLGVSAQLVGRWRRRFVEGGAAALCDLPRVGAPTLVTEAPGRARPTEPQANVSPATAARIRRAEALQPTPSLRLVAVHVHGNACVAAFAPTSRGETLEAPGRKIAASAAAAKRELTRRLAEQTLAIAKFRSQSTGGMKLRRFLRSLVRVLATDAEPSPAIHLAVSSAESPTRAVRRWLSKRPQVLVHVLGSSRRWWSLLAQWLENAPAGQDLEQLALELAIARHLSTRSSSRLFTWTVRRGVVAVEAIHYSDSNARGRSSG